MRNTVLTDASILIIEDETLLRKQISAYLERQGAGVMGVGSLEQSRQVIKDMSFDYVLLDVNLPDGKGTDLLKEKAFSDNATVIVMTAEGGIQGAVEAMRAGAADYLVKPFDPGELPLVIQRAKSFRQSRRLEEHRKEKFAAEEKAFFFGESLAAIQEQMEKILAADRRLETHLPPILIEGETGTGKTTVARWIHNQGPRSENPLVEINCSALPETLAESELFGHERGAFTDARTARMGLFEAAHGGTLFLDELPSLAPPLQAKVLTAIEDHKIRRLGGHKEITVDVRVIAATNVDLKQHVAEGRFREDLYHRLDLYRLYLPPLRERGGDLLKLAEIYVERLCRRHKIKKKSISEAGKRLLKMYPWPGNVRELAHELERAIVFEDGASLEFQQLARTADAASGGFDPDDWFNERFEYPESGFSLEAAIDRMIQHALKQTRQNVSAAARLLGVSRDYVRYRLEGKKGDKSKNE